MNPDKSDQHHDEPASPPNRDNGAVDPEGVLTLLGRLPPGTLITEEALARLVSKCTKSIKRAVHRGELPPSVKVMGKPSWTVGSILRHIEERLQRAAKQAERHARRLADLTP